MFTLIEVYIINGKRYVVCTRMVETVDGGYRPESYLQPAGRGYLEAAMYRYVPPANNKSSLHGWCVSIARALLQTGHGGTVASAEQACLAVASMVAQADPTIDQAALAAIIFVQLGKTH